MLRINRTSDSSILEKRATVDDFIVQPIYYPDQPTVKWQNAANGGMAVDNLLLGKFKVVVVGRGASALAVMSELQDIARKNPRLTIEVENLYYDPEVGDPDNLVNYKSKWGRIFATKPGPNEQEIGCMRFPSIAVLTWTFINKVYGDRSNEELVAFPNPGVVPTQFIFRDMNVAFERDSNAPGGVAPIAGMNSPLQVKNFAVMEQVKNGVIGYLLTLAPTSDPKLTADYFALQLIGSIGKPPPVETTPGLAMQVWSEWEAFADATDGPLINTVRAAVQAVVDDSKYPDVVVTEERNLDYYVELFGRYGFGTGGFRPLNNVTFTDIARLLIWNYSNEYLFPGNPGNSTVPNSEFAQGLLDKIADRSVGNFSYVAFESAEVLFAGRATEAESVDIYYRDHTAGNAIKDISADYAVFGLPHHAAQKIFEPFSGLRPSEVIEADTELFLDNGQKISVKNQVRNPVDYNVGDEGIVTSALKRLHMMRSTKYFADIDVNAYEALAPVDGSGTKRIKVLISDTDCAATYFLDGAPGSNTVSVLVSYTWGDEASNEAIRLAGLTPTAGSANNPQLLGRHARATNRMANYSPTEDDAAATNLWLSTLLAQGPSASKSGYMWDWTSDRSARGGFKLDWAGENHFSRALNSLSRQSVLAAEATSGPKQRVFLAGDSMSHYGGWLEGAFITSLTAVAGLVRTQFSENGLSEEGKKMFLQP